MKIAKFSKSINLYDQAYIFEKNKNFKLMMSVPTIGNQKKVKSNYKKL